MSNIALNDGIFHPYYNRYGWRCRYVNDVNNYWDADLGETYMITSTETCFAVNLIYQGTDNNVKYVSGRPDGRIITTDAQTAADVVEW